ncbi:MAG: molybdopterin-dependent oxidoreductase [Phycisphaerae bacterium]|nr:molybdopterin-dependent oxidoreductase [Phycisphaerae bacterium]
MFEDSTRLSRVLSVRCSLTRYLLPALILTSSSWPPLNAKHCLDPPPITSNDEFFTLSRIPQWQGEWTLDIDGEVERPLSLSLDELREYPQTDIEATLECDYASGPPLLVGSAVWSGVSLRSLIELAAPKPTASSVTFTALDGYRRGPFPLAQVLQKTDALVAYEMNGEPLPQIQGWPARIALPGHTGNQWVRWLDRIEISSARAGDSFRQWPIHARIMEPTYNAIVDNCRLTIKGMANAGEGKEIVTVEVSTDDGATWENAEILTYFTPNVWKHWRYIWTPETTGRQTIFARVIDEDGNVQDEDRPYGWQGYKVVVTVLPGTDCADPQRADLNNDYFVDFADFSHLADKWLVTGVGLAADVMPGQGDGQVAIGDLVLIADQWLNCFVPAAADPLPADGQEIADLSPVLAWLPREQLTGYDVYFGTNACSVAAASGDSQEFLGFVTDNGFALDRVLEYDTVYYWRVDQVGYKCTTAGEVWSFTTTGDSTE